MPILDYSTRVPGARTVAEVEAKLARAKAEAILKEYDSDGMVSALSFRIRTEFGVLTFLLPANIQRVYQAIVRDTRIPPSLRTKEQAGRVAWRIVKDWLEAQLAMIEAGLVDLEQVFLAYAQDATGRTFYELMRERNSQGPRIRSWEHDIDPHSPASRTGRVQSGNGSPMFRSGF